MAVNYPIIGCWVVDDGSLRVVFQRQTRSSLSMVKNGCVHVLVSRRLTNTALRFIEVVDLGACAQPRQRAPGFSHKLSHTPKLLGTSKKSPDKQNPDAGFISGLRAKRKDASFRGCITSRSYRPSKFWKNRKNWNLGSIFPAWPDQPLFPPATTPGGMSIDGRYAVHDAHFGGLLKDSALLALFKLILTPADHKAMSSARSTQATNIPSLLRIEMLTHFRVLVFLNPSVTTANSLRLHHLHHLHHLPTTQLAKKAQTLLLPIIPIFNLFSSSSTTFSSATTTDPSASRKALPELFYFKTYDGA